MVKNSIIFLSFSIVLQTQAMQNPLCFMPIEVQNYIAYFLTYDDETEEEFIARTKNVQIPGYGYDEFLTTENSVFKVLPKPLPSSIGTLRMFSSDETKVVTLRLSSESDFHSILTIIDLEKNEIICIDAMFGKGNYKCVALSSFPYMIATIEDLPERDKCSTFKFYQTCKKSLIITDFVEKQTKKIEIPEVKVASIGFNKQGTHIIAHQAHDEHLKQYSVPLIYPIKLYGYHREMFKNRDCIKIPTLQDYFRDRMICKNIEASK